MECWLCPLCSQTMKGRSTRKEISSIYTKMDYYSSGCVIVLKRVQWSDGSCINTTRKIQTKWRQYLCFWQQVKACPNSSPDALCTSTDQLRMSVKLSKRTMQIILALIIGYFSSNLTLHKYEVSLTIFVPYYFHSWIETYPDTLSRFH